MTDRMSVDEYRRSQNLPPRGQQCVFQTTPGGEIADRLEDRFQAATGKAHHALGRQSSTEMNKTEARYEREVLAPAKLAGEIVWYAFNSIKFRIAADRCWLTIDFLVQYPDGRFEAIDVKGAKAIVEEDAKVKMKVAASAYPFAFKMVFPRPRKLGGGWLVEEVRK